MSNKGIRVFGIAEEWPTWPVTTMLWAMTGLIRLLTSGSGA
ncbi:hypothetical protein AB0I35_02280 [Nocardia sp. NPDC050378]